MASFWIILLTVIVAGINEGSTGAVEQKCMDMCSCCGSAPDGSRNLSDICTSSNNYNYCIHGCLDGYYGSVCVNTCPVYCTRCANELGSRDNKICYLCADGYYNGTGVTDCSTPCPTNCKNNRCDKSSGRCLDGCTSDSMAGDKCDICSSGYYGGSCVPCPEYCKDDICHLSNGGCTDGCKEPRFTGAQCDQCQTGKHGEHCDENCPANCRDSVCDRQKGTCTRGCTGNFDGDKCEKCDPHYYAESCDKVCNDCLQGQCDRTTGICDDCINGRHGQYCNITCSSGCRNSGCYRYNATCTQGCRSAYSGDKCCVNNKNCELCDMIYSCSNCKTGYYGTSCGQTCPDKCAEGCDKLSGNCTACEPGYHGNKCEKACPNQCLDSKCHQQSGQCIVCKKGYYGNFCNNTCPANCVDNTCEQKGGKCGDCMVGYHGASCDLDCTTYCINETCIQETSACMYGCVDEYMDKCTQNNVEANDNIGAILGGVVGGLWVVIIILVGYIIHSRRRSRGTKENSEQEPNNGVELEEQHDYEGLDGELKNEKTVYSDLQSDGEYVNTRITIHN